MTTNTAAALRALEQECREIAATKSHAPNHFRLQRAMLNCADKLAAVLTQEGVDKVCICPLFNCPVHCFQLLPDKDLPENWQCELVAHGRWKNDSEVEICAASDRDQFGLYKCDNAPAEPRAASDEPLFTASMYGTADAAIKARDEWRAAQSEPRAAEGAGTDQVTCTECKHEFSMHVGDQTMIECPACNKVICLFRVASQPGNGEGV